jgi:hypothetical protein
MMRIIYCSQHAINQFLLFIFQFAPSLTLFSLTKKKRNILHSSNESILGTLSDAFNLQMTVKRAKCAEISISTLAHTPDARILFHRKLTLFLSRSQKKRRAEKRKKINVEKFMKALYIPVISFRSEYTLCIIYEL